MEYSINELSNVSEEHNKNELDFAWIYSIKKDNDKAFKYLDQAYDEVKSKITGDSLNLLQATSLLQEFVSREV